LPKSSWVSPTPCAWWMLWSS